MHLILCQLLQRLVAGRRSAACFQNSDDGVWPTGTRQFEKRNIAVLIPVWNEKTCIQCHRCLYCVLMLLSDQKHTIQIP